MLTWNKRKTEFGYTINIIDDDRELLMTLWGQFRFILVFGYKE